MTKIVYKGLLQSILRRSKSLPCILLCLFFILIALSPPASADSQSLSCSGNVPDSDVWMYFLVNANKGVYDYSFHNALVEHHSVYVDTMPMHFWLEGRVDHVGNGYLMVSSTTGGVITTLSGLECSPRNDLSVSLASEISLIVGALTGIAFIMSFSSARIV